MPAPRQASPLCLAIEARQWEEASRLLVEGADPNSCNRSHDTAVLLACVMAQHEQDMAPARELLRALIVAGGDPERQNATCESARSYLERFPEDYAGWDRVIEQALAERAASALDTATPPAATPSPRRSL